MPFTENEQTEAAKALDITNLEVGTWLRYSTDSGFAGRRRHVGEIIKVTEKSYMVRDYIGRSARLSRDLQDLRDRQVRAVRTPAEQAAYKAEAIRVNEERVAERQREAGEAEARRIRTNAEKTAKDMLVARHQIEYDLLVANVMAGNA